MRYVLFDRGCVADEYASVPEYYGPLPPGDVVALGANPTVVARLTGAEPARVRAVARTASSPDELPPAPELLARARRSLGLEGAGRGRLNACHAVRRRTLSLLRARRIVLAEKGVDYDAVEIDLDDRPAWLYEKNPLGRVPVLRGGRRFVLPESP